MDSRALVEETESEEDQQGWLATFADLMSLLMCFFVLLLSFSEMDVIKFKQIAGSMKTAFGVQTVVEAESIPKGTSVIAQEFSAGKPEPTVLNEVRQQANSLEVSEPDSADEGAATDSDKDGQLTDTEKLALRIEAEFSEELLSGEFELDQQGQQLIIRFEEQGMFASGSGYLQPKFKPLLRDMAVFLADIPGRLTVSGHTDDVRVNNELYEDNLSLSSDRALAVARELKKNSDIRYVQVSAWADATPLLPNTSDFNRAKNRRVEISILQGEAKEAVLTQSQLEGKNG